MLYNCYVPTYHRFLRQRLLLKHQNVKINKTKILLKYFFGARGVQFLEKRRENVQILPESVSNFTILHLSQCLTLFLTPFYSVNPHVCIEFQQTLLITCALSILFL
jgi:hypothetical protein